MTEVQINFRSEPYPAPGATWWTPWCGHVQRGRVKPCSDCTPPTELLCREPLRAGSDYRCCKVLGPHVRHRDGNGTTWWTDCTDLVPVANTFCYIHGVCEPDLPGDYRACGECGHVYRTVWDLLTEELLFWRRGVMGGWVDSMEVGPLGDPDRIFSCPLCTHDF